MFGSIFKPNTYIVDSTLFEDVVWNGLLDDVWYCKMIRISGGEGLLELVVEHIDSDFPIIRKYITYNEDDVIENAEEYVEYWKMMIENDLEKIKCERNETC